MGIEFRTGAAFWKGFQVIDARSLVEDDVSARYAVREPDSYEQELGWYRDRPRPFLGRGFFLFRRNQKR